MKKRRNNAPILRHSVSVIALILLHFLSISSASINENSNEIVEVFIVSHSHDDTGWLRPVDEYYEYEVSYILDTVTACLAENPNRKFIQVEMAFFTRWWNDQTDFKKQQVRQLVQNGQFEFINGGWCMNDEAITSYVDIIDQMTEGQLFILDTFGVTPKIAWHIDPFGSSNVSPSLWAELGFYAFVINRIDYRLKAKMKVTKELEFVWRGSKSLGEAAQMFTHVMDSHYCTPKGFDWEHGVSQVLPEEDGPPPVINNPPSYLTKENIGERAREFANMSLSRAAWFKTPHILIPFGCDFNFQNAWMKYKNMDKLIDYINAHSDELGIRAHYSTLSDYFETLNAYQNHPSNSVQWSVRTDDFFPYADDSESYWSGYYTSRPDLKQLTRQSDGVLRISELLNAFTTSIVQSSSIDFSSYFPYNVEQTKQSISILRQAAALVQHHDAITGTERRVVYRDYKKRLFYGIENANNISSLSLSYLTQNSGKNITANPVLLTEAIWEKKIVEVVVFNSLEFTRTQYLNLSIPTPYIQNVTDSTGVPVPFQITDDYSFNRTGYMIYILTTIPPLGFNTYIITPSDRPNPSPYYIPTQSIPLPTYQNISIANEYISVKFNSITGEISSLYNYLNNTSIEVNQFFKCYSPVNDSNQSSDAYIFRPSNITPPYYLHVTSMKLSSGPLLDQIQLVYNESSITQVVRVYKGLSELMGNFVELEIHIGTINITDRDPYWGKEYVTLFRSDLSNQKTFYTDNNGMEMQKRTTHPIGRVGDADKGVRLAGNYYPVVSRAFIRDDFSQRQFTILTSHSHGGSSLYEGELEMMLHRRLLINDRRGVGQALNDTHQTTPVMWLLSSDPVHSAKLHRRLANVLQSPLQPFFHLASAQFPIRIPQFSGLLSDFPINLRMISLKERNAAKSTVIMRLMNIFEVDENPLYSQPVTINLYEIFSKNFTISNIEEVTLTATMSASENIRPHWNVANNTTPRKDQTFTELMNSQSIITSTSYFVTLYPMEIKTFLLSPSFN